MHQQVTPVMQVLGRPVVSADELKEILEKRHEIQEQIVWAELAYYHDTHKSDVMSNPGLFKLNKVTHEERLTNMCILLNDSSLTVLIPLPKNTDSLIVLQATVKPVAEVIDEPLLAVNQICITLWIEDMEEKPGTLDTARKYEIRKHLFSNTLNA